MAYVSDHEIHALNAAAALTGAELVPCALTGQEATMTTTQDIANLFVETLQIQQSGVSSQFDVTSNTTLANIPGLSVNVTAGKTYKFEAFIFTNSNLASGVKFAISGTAIPISIIYASHSTGGNAPTTSVSSSLNGVVGDITLTIPSLARTMINGTIVVDNSGTLTIQFAQNSSNIATSSVLAGSNFTVTEIL